MRAWSFGFQAGDIGLLIVLAGKRSDFLLSSLDSFLSSPYLVPNISVAGYRQVDRNSD